MAVESDNSYDVISTRCRTEFNVHMPEMWRAVRVLDQRIGVERSHVRNLSPHVIPWMQKLGR
jgi:hypothetical protein